MGLKPHNPRVNNLAVGHLQCTICGYTSNMTTALNQHIRTHTNEKPFECHYCGMRSRTKSHNRLHIKRRHTGEGKPYKCMRCGRYLSSQENLSKHQRRKHGMTIEAKPKSEPKRKSSHQKSRGESMLSATPACPESVTFSFEELYAATEQWKQRISSEPDLFKPELPLNMLYQDPNYLSQELRVRVATKVKRNMHKLRKELDGDGSHYMYTLHDPSFTKVPLHQILASVDQHTRFQIFLSSLIYIGTGKDDRDISHMSNHANRNPKKMDRIEEIKAKGFEVIVHRFSSGLNRKQGQYLEALALRSTRLGGRLVNLKEEKPGKIISDSIEVQMAMGAQVLWEGSRTFGRQSSQVGGDGSLMQCGLCFEANSLTTYRTTDRKAMDEHQRLAHRDLGSHLYPARTFGLPTDQELVDLLPLANLSFKDLHSGNEKWIREKVKADIMIKRMKERENTNNCIGTTPQRERGRETYTEEEEHKILDYILVRERLEARDWSVGGNHVWMIMERQGALPGRSWQSMKERFRRVILRKIIRGSYNYVMNEEQKDLLHKLRDFNTIRETATA